MRTIRFAATALCAATFAIAGSLVSPSAKADGGKVGEQATRVPLKTGPSHAIEAPKPQSFNWQGIYAGAGMGGSWSSVDHDVVHSNGLSEKFHFNRPSRIGGFHGGVQAQWGNLVLGLEASLTGGSFAGHKKTRRIDDLAEISDIDWQFMLTPRIGYAIDNMHFYIKGGYASAEVYRGVANYSTGNVLVGSHHRESGWTVGAGFEHALSRWVVIGVDYSYVRIEPGTRSAWPQFVATGFVPGSGRVRELEAHSIMARLTFMIGQL